MEIFPLVIVTLNTQNMFAYGKLIRLCKFIYNCCKDHKELRRVSFRTKIVKLKEDFLSFYGPVQSEYFILQNGKKDGYYRHWYKNGQLMNEYFYNAGKLEGSIEHWNIDGTPYTKFEL